MSLVVTQRPSQTIGSETSTWNAIGNPVLYKMQRKDYVFNQINDSGGAIQLQFNSVNIASSFTSGDILYLQSDNGVYDMAVNVSTSTFSSPNTLVLCQEDYISAAPGGFVNNETTRQNYRTESEIYKSSDDTILTDYVLENSPTGKGAVIINVSDVIRQFLLADNDANITGTTEVFDDTNVYLGFYIKYREVWTGSSESQTNDVANKFFAVLGSRQIPSTYGGNMGEYAVRPSTEVLNDTAFNSNWTNQGGVDVAWTLGATQLDVVLDNSQSERVRRSLTLTAGKLYRIEVNCELTTGSANVDLILYCGGSQAVFILENENVNTTFNKIVYLIPTSDYTYFELFALATDPENVIVYDITIDELTLTNFLTKLERPVMWRGYPFLISAIINEGISNNVYLDATDTTTPADYAGKIVEFDLNQIITDQTVDTIDIAIFEDDTPDVQLSETLTVELRDACDNPILLLGRNSLGGNLDWLFDYSQDYTFDYGNGRKAQRKVLFANNLTINQWESLQDFITLGEVYRNNIVEFLATTIKTSSRIGQQVYAVDSDGNKIGVLVIATRNTTRTKKVKHTFEIEIEYPEFFTA